MIDQKIIVVDNRGITRDLAMRLFEQDYTRELTQIGRFFDENAQMVNHIIAQHHLAEMSRGRDVSFVTIEHFVHTLITRDLCRYFPNITGPQIEHAKMLFLDTLHDSFYNRVPVQQVAWDHCVAKELNLGSYAIICTRQIAQPLPGLGDHGVFQYPINTPRPSQYAM